MREAAGAHELLDGVGRLGLAEQDAVDAARRGSGGTCQALKATLGPSMPLTGASTITVGREMTERVGPPSSRPRMYSSSPVMSKGAVLHADIDVVGPGPWRPAALLVGQHMAGVGPS
jgi:hypothetical protein